MARKRKTKETERHEAGCLGKDGHRAHGGAGAWEHSAGAWEDT